MRLPNFFYFFIFPQALDLHLHADLPDLFYFTRLPFYFYCLLLITHPSIYLYLYFLVVFTYLPTYLLDCLLSYWYLLSYFVLTCFKTLTNYYYVHTYLLTCDC